jgi:aryl-alcohol dehydrogenase-like predicted oxidoreductase
MMMQTRILGNTGYEISEIGFGAWQIGADWGAEVSRDTALEALGAAADAGVNFIDTADVYGGGRSEEIVGEFIKSRPSGSIRVATKMGRATETWDDGYDEIAAAAEASCRRLGVDGIDLVQLHCIPDETLRGGRVFENLQKVKDAGLIRHYGASVETIDEALFCIRSSPASTLQVIFNIFRQRVVTDLLQAAQVNHIGIIARVPLASGLLSGKFSSGHQFGDGDHRSFNADGQCFNVGETFAGVPFEDGVRFASKVGEILQDECPGATLAQKSLRWVLDHEAVSAVIPGAKDAGQARDNAAVSAMAPLSERAHEELRGLYVAEIDAAVRGRY